MMLLRFTSVNSSCKIGRPARRHIRAWLWIILAGSLLLMSACSRAEDASEPNIDAILPINWGFVLGNASRFSLASPSKWEPVNIDGDGESEHLLLYAYGIRNLDFSEETPDTERPDPIAGASVGAMIVDVQESSENVVGSPALVTPLQPSATFVPYRVAPSYLLSPNTGPVGVYRGADKIQYFQYATDADGLCANPGGDPNELALYDSEQTLTFAWWRDAYLGYGATQLHAPGGFRNVTVLGNGDPVSMALNELNQPIGAIDLLYPLAQPENPLDARVEGGFADLQRSRLCRVRRFYRQPASSTEAGAYRADIHFVDDDLGIQFCRSDEQDPFFPEAVVMQSLTAEESLVRTLSISPRLDISQVQLITSTMELLDQTQTRPLKTCGNADANVSLPRYRISDLVTRAALEYGDPYRLNRAPNQADISRLLSFVCAEITPIDVTSGEATTEGKHFLFFSLEHEPPASIEVNGETIHLPDRFVIVDMENANDWGQSDCKSIIAQNTPEVGAP
ncbi:MAG: hypothetical protein H6642_14550 [Caldilineaceae bacterium]|nr:hypothetical protein [Caldilineaceae bacterium]